MLRSFLSFMHNLLTNTKDFIYSPFKEIGAAHACPFQRWPTREMTCFKGTFLTLNLCRSQTEWSVIPCLFERFPKERPTAGESYWFHFCIQMWWMKLLLLLTFQSFWAEMKEITGLDNTYASLSKALTTAGNSRKSTSVNISCIRRAVNNFGWDSEV